MNDLCTAHSGNEEQKGLDAEQQAKNAVERRFSMGIGSQSPKKTCSGS